MKKAIVLQVRESKDKDTGEALVWVTFALMPTVIKSGVHKDSLFYPKSTEIIKTACFGAIKAPDKYAKNKTLKIGSVVDVTYDYNEVLDKSYINDVDVTVQSPFKPEELFI